MPHGFVLYRPGFAGGGNDEWVLAAIMYAVRGAGAAVLDRPERPVLPRNISFKFLAADHPLDDIGRDFRVILIHPLPDGDEDALAVEIAEAIEEAILERDLLLRLITFSVSLCLGRMGFTGFDMG